MPVMECRLMGMPSSWAAAQNGSYTSELYGWSVGGEHQIMAPLRPAFAQRTSSCAPALGSYSEIKASPAIRSGA